MCGEIRDGKTLEQEILEIIKREGKKAEAEIDELSENFDRQFKTLNEIIDEYKKPWE